MINYKTMFYKWNYVTWGDDTPSESHKLSNKKPSTIRGKEISPNCWSRKCGTLPKIQPIAIDFGFLSEVECKSLLLKRPPTLCIGLGYFPPCQDNGKTSFFESTKVTLSFFLFLLLALSQGISMNLRLASEGRTSLSLPFLKLQGSGIMPSMTLFQFWQVPLVNILWRHHQLILWWLFLDCPLPLGHM